MIIRVAKKGGSTARGKATLFANKGVPVLPVHDSFIIAAQHQQELVAVMKRVFGERFGGADINVTVK